MLITPDIANLILSKVGKRRTIAVSLDLGLTEVEITLEKDRLVLPTGETLTLDELQRIKRRNPSVYQVIEGTLEKIGFFSDETNLYYRLIPTVTYPAMEISGILMHRISKKTDPKTDVTAKLACIAPLTGPMLDTCCGLGYTAIHASREGVPVTTIEKDPNVLELARLNPFSRELFDNPGINLVSADISEFVQTEMDRSYDAILHDPPSFAIAGELYSEKLYRQFHRILRPGGKLLHYTGKPGSRKRGVDLPRDVASRLAKSGFREPQWHEELLSHITAKPE